MPSVFLFLWSVTLAHENLCMRILASILQDGGNPFPVTTLRLLSVPGFKNVTDAYLALPLFYLVILLMFRFVIQKCTCTHAHEYRFLGDSCSYMYSKSSVGKKRTDCTQETFSSLSAYFLSLSTMLV